MNTQKKSAAPWKEISANQSESSRDNYSKTITPKPPLKAEASLAAFIKRKSMNTFEANREYGDTCLHTSVSDLFRNYRIEFDRDYESILNRAGRRVTVKRYKPRNIEQLKILLADLRTARGVGGVL